MENEDSEMKESKEEEDLIILNSWSGNDSSVWNLTEELSTGKISLNHKVNVLLSAKKVADFSGKQTPRTAKRKQD